jgi:hypothetical protein
MFMTTAVVSPIGIARWLERRIVRLTDNEIRTAKLVAFLGAILIMLGVIADRVARTAVSTLLSLTADDGLWPEARLDQGQRPRHR